MPQFVTSWWAPVFKNLFKVDILFLYYQTTQVVRRILTSQYWVFSPNWICHSNIPPHTITSLRPTPAGLDTAMSRYMWMVRISVMGCFLCVWMNAWLSFIHIVISSGFNPSCSFRLNCITLWMCEIVLFVTWSHLQNFTGYFTQMRPKSLIDWILMCSLLLWLATSWYPHRFIILFCSLRQIRVGRIGVIPMTNQ